jgi:hypothetical protein
MDSANSTAKIGTETNAGSASRFDADESPCQAACRAGATTPYAAATDTRFITAAYRDGHARKGTRSSSIDRGHHAADQQRDPLGDVLRGVDGGGRDPAEVQVVSVPAVEAGIVVSGNRCTKSSLFGSCGPVLGTTASTAVLPAEFNCTRGNGGDAWCPRQVCGEPCKRPGLAGAGQPGRQQQRPVGAFAEPLGQWSCAFRVDVVAGLLPASGKPNGHQGTGSPARAGSRPRRGQRARGAARPGGSTAAMPGRLDVSADLNVWLAVGPSDSRSRSMSGPGSRTASGRA